MRSNRRSKSRVPPTSGSRVLLPGSSVDVTLAVGDVDVTLAVGVDVTFAVGVVKGIGVGKVLIFADTDTMFDIGLSKDCSSDAVRAKK